MWLGVAHFGLGFSCVYFEALLDQLQEAGTSGETVPSENLDKLLDEAKRMVKEMEDRDFTPQKTAAEEERDDAQKCKEESECEMNYVKFRLMSNNNISCRKILNGKFSLLLLLLAVHFTKCVLSNKQVSPLQITLRSKRSLC